MALNKIKMGQISMDTSEYDALKKVEAQLEHRVADLQKAQEEILKLHEEKEALMAKNSLQVVKRTEVRRVYTLKEDILAQAIRRVHNYHTSGRRYFDYDEFFETVKRELNTIVRTEDGFLMHKEIELDKSYETMEGFETIKAELYEEAKKELVQEAKYIESKGKEIEEGWANAITLNDKIVEAKRELESIKSDIEDADNCTKAAEERTEKAVKRAKEYEELANKMAMEKRPLLMFYDAVKTASQGAFSFGTRKVAMSKIHGFIEEREAILKEERMREQIKAELKKEEDGRNDKSI